MPVVAEGEVYSSIYADNGREGKGKEEGVRKRKMERLYQQQSHRMMRWLAGGVTEFRETRGWWVQIELWHEGCREKKEEERQEVEEKRKKEKKEKEKKNKKKKNRKRIATVIE